MMYLKILFFSFCFLLLGEMKSQSVDVFSADSLYNLGNTASSANQYDQAIFYYEKAKLLDPTGNDIAINLQLSKEKLSTDIIEIEPFFLSTWWHSVCNQLLPGGWKIVSLLFLISLLILVYFHYFKSKIENSTLFHALCGLLLVLFLGSILAGSTRTNQIFNSQYAIVFGGEQSLYLGPDEVSDKVKQITGGNKIRIIDTDGEWYKVSAMDSEQGWIRSKDVRRIRFVK